MVNLRLIIKQIITKNGDLFPSFSFVAVKKQGRSKHTSVISGKTMLFKWYYFMRQKKIPFRITITLGTACGSFTLPILCFLRLSLFSSNHRTQQYKMSLQVNCFKMHWSPVSMALLLTVQKLLNVTVLGVW